MSDYSPTDDSAKSYDEAIKALRDQLASGIPVTVFGQTIHPEKEVPMGIAWKGRGRRG